MTGGERLEPITLEGHHVRLEPLSLAHLDDLAQVAFDEEIWLLRDHRPSYHRLRVSGGTPAK